MWITRVTRQIETLAVRNRLIYSAVSLYYREMVRRESQAAAVGPKDRVLCIGGGICPYTAILFHHYTGAEVTVIDHDELCVEHCREFLKGLGLTGVQVQLADGREVDYSGYSVIHLALQISPKEEVVRRILAQAQAGTRVLVRMPKEGVAGLYCPLAWERLLPVEKVEHSSLSNVAQTCILVVPGKGAWVAV